MSALAGLGVQLGKAGHGWEIPQVISGLFGEQRRFFDDPSETKAALCGRRSGKTWAVASWLLAGAADSPGELSVYIATRRIQARNVLWRTLRRIDEHYRLGLKFSEVDKQLHVTTPNGHTLWLAGCDDAAEIEKFRGPHYRRAALEA